MMVLKIQNLRFLDQVLEFKSLWFSIHHLLLFTEPDFFTEKFNKNHFAKSTLRKKL